MWTGPRLPKGYGRFKIDGIRFAVYAHRLSWEIHRGPIPDGLFVLHRCDTPACVNPDHLFLGSAKDNAQDCIAKGRAAPTEQTRHVGSTNGRAKVTETDILEIRRLFANAPRGKNAIRIQMGALAAIAEKFHITVQMVYYIAKRKNWRHVS